MAVGIGPTAKANGQQSVAVGNSVEASGNFPAIGTSARANAAQTVALGNNANAAGEDALAIGRSANAQAKDSIAFGRSLRQLPRVLLLVRMPALPWPILLP